VKSECWMSAIAMTVLLIWFCNSRDIKCHEAPLSLRVEMPRTSGDDIPTITSLKGGRVLGLPENLADYRGTRPIAGKLD